MQTLLTLKLSKTQLKCLNKYEKNGGFLPALIPIVTGAITAGTALYNSYNNKKLMINYQKKKSDTTKFQRNLRMKVLVCFSKNLKVLECFLKNLKALECFLKKFEIPIKPLSNFDLENYANQLNIKHFRGVFMKDNLPSSKTIKNMKVE